MRNGKFDCVLMNPPYDNKLHEKFLIKVLRISKRGVTIQPAVWINKAKRRRKTFQEVLNAANGRIVDIELINHLEMNNFFGTGHSLQDGGIFTWDEQSSLDLFNFGYSNETEHSLFEKTNPDNNNNMALIRNYGCKVVNPKKYEKQDNEVAVYSWHGGSNAYNAVILQENVYNQKKSALLLVFKDKNEADNFKESLKTKFANWYFDNYVVPGDYKIHHYMFRMKDYSKPWTDERFYNFFHLTNDEIKIIEDNYKN